MSYTFEDIKNFIVRETAVSEQEVTLTCELNNDLRIWGDDLDDLMEAYEKEFHVDMSTYRWYFHTLEEGNVYSLGRSIFKPPYDRVKHIPITPAELLEFANNGKWSITYPEHKISDKRYDRVVDGIVWSAIIIFLFYRCTH